MRLHRKKVAVTAPPPSPRFKALVRWHNPAIGCKIKATKRGLSPHSVLYAGYVLMKKKILPKAGGQRYLAIKCHAHPTINHISILDASTSRATLLP